MLLFIFYTTTTSTMKSLEIRKFTRGQNNFMKWLIFMMGIYEQLCLYKI